MTKRAPVDNGNSGDIANGVLVLLAGAELNKVILRRWDAIASDRATESRLPRYAAATDQNTAGR